VFRRLIEVRTDEDKTHHPFEAGGLPVRELENRAMSLTSSETAHLLLATVLLLAAAILFGQLFARLHYPRVIGEILGGLALGPTLLGWALPMTEQNIFPATGATAVVLGALYQLGLIFLMFATGTELSSLFQRKERRAAVMITVTGVVLPLLAGFLQGLAWSAVERGGDCVEVLGGVSGEVYSACWISCAATHRQTSTQCRSRGASVHEPMSEMAPRREPGKCRWCAQLR
jgi:hypothetical protein